MGLIIIGLHPDDNVSRESIERLMVHNEVTLIALPERGISINTEPSRHEYKLEALPLPEPLLTCKDLHTQDKKQSQQGWRTKRNKHIK